MGQHHGRCHRSCLPHPAGLVGDVLNGLGHVTRMGAHSVATFQHQACRLTACSSDSEAARSQDSKPSFCFETAGPLTCNMPTKGPQLQDKGMKVRGPDFGCCGFRLQLATLRRHSFRLQPMTLAKHVPASGKPCLQVRKGTDISPGAPMLRPGLQEDLGKEKSFPVSSTLAICCRKSALTMFRAHELLDLALAC